MRTHLSNSRERLRRAQELLEPEVMGDEGSYLVADACSFRA